MSFSQQAWQHIAPIRNAIEEMAFLRELAAGTLRRESFQFYMVQDALYLAEYSRALALAAASAPTHDATLFFAQSAETALVVEQALHRSFFAQFGIAENEAAKTEPSPTCLAYTSFLLATAQTKSYPVLLAAILPCFWIYKDVGDRIAMSAARDNPYQAWIDTYTDADFEAATVQARTLTDVAAAATGESERTEMLQAFTRCSQYEWMFWDSAYRLESWPI